MQVNVRKQYLAWLDTFIIASFRASQMNFETIHSFEGRLSIIEEKVVWLLYGGELIISHIFMRDTFEIEVRMFLLVQRVIEVTTSVTYQTLMSDGS